mmetsp:Transcript_20796/g.36691  ORF Transcript_20796/g.36691 Transcript_20796/m.36691 type:complete len:312 (-) Transcript_20796:294-1229(-)
MPLCRARSSSRRSSSTRRTRLWPSGPRCWSSPSSTSSSMKPALPSKPTALPNTGPSKSSASPASRKAAQMVSSLLLEMMPRISPASRRTCSRGRSMGARSRSSTCLRHLCAVSPGEAVRVPSKSKKTQPTSPVTSLSSWRLGSGDDVPGVKEPCRKDREAQDDGVARFSDLGLRILPENIIPSRDMSGEHSVLITGGEEANSVMLGGLRLCLLSARPPSSPCCGRVSCSPWLLSCPRPQASVSPLSGELLDSSVLPLSPTSASLFAGGDPMLCASRHLKESRLAGTLDLASRGSCSGSVAGTGSAAVSCRL